jgi:protein-S-isoprenylcysteine O-methyltransferase Ste14
MYFSLVTNFLVVSTMLFQQVICTTKDMKHTFTKRATSDMIYYPKFISRFVSAFTISMMHMLYQPMNFRHLDIYPKLDLSIHIRYIWFYILTIIGIVLVLSCSYFHIIKNDELGLVMIKKFITGEEIPKLSEYMYDKGIFNYIRSPFRAGMILIIIFINPQWDLGRLELVLLFIFAMYIEAVNDDRYFYTKHESYKKYMKKVKSRFFNFDYLIGLKSDEIDEKDDIKINDISEKEKEKKN